MRIVRRVIAGLVLSGFVLVLSGCATSTSEPWAYVESQSDSVPNATIDLTKHRHDYRRIMHFTIYREEIGSINPVPVLQSYPQRPSWVLAADYNYEINYGYHRVPSRFELRPGRYFINTIVNYTKGDYFDEGTRLIGWIDLEPGHYYVLRGRYTRFRKGGYATWIEDEATGEIAAGKRKYPYEE